MTQTALTIGTRGSALAMRQTEMVQESLCVQLDVAADIREFSTRGDRETDKPLPEVGGKGLFTEELESALIAGEIDLAVHSLKDLPTEMRPELTVGAIPKRESPLDALVGPCRFEEIEKGSTLGTSSLRRRAQILHRRSDLCVVELRGNLQTRLRKVEHPDPPEAAILAEAGLSRLGLQEHIVETFAPGFMLPAAGQGALGIQCRAGDERILELLASLDDARTRAETVAERALLDRLGGGCQIPVGCLARVEGERITLQAGVFSLDGTVAVRSGDAGHVGEAERIGVGLAESLLDMGARDVLKEIEQG